MRILCIGDATVASGFSFCTHAICDQLHDRGHHLKVLGIHFCGEPHDYPYDIYPTINPYKGFIDKLGISRAEHELTTLKYDAVVIVTDVWTIDLYVSELKSRVESLPPIIAQIAVDGYNQRRGKLDELSGIIVWDSFARDELLGAGVETEILSCPLGVDSKTFYPESKPDCHEVMGLGKIWDNLAVTSSVGESFKIGFVGRNCMRKRIDLLINYFSCWISQAEPSLDPVLIIQTARSGATGFDIVSLANYYGVRGRVVVLEVEQQHGIPEPQMRYLYGCFDVFVTVSQGEGFCLPALEAMACGVPCLLPSWSGVGGWAKNSCVQFGHTDSISMAPCDFNSYTIGFVPDKASVINGLNLLTDPGTREVYIKKGIELSSSMSRHSSSVVMADFVERIGAEHNAV